MDYSIHQYTGDGLEQIRQFYPDRIFATDVMELVRNRPDGDRWFLKSSQQTGPGVFIVTFITNEYLSPNQPNGKLRVKATAPERLDGDWIISVV